MRYINLHFTYFLTSCMVYALTEVLFYSIAALETRS